jgi:hypothetical protein
MGRNATININNKTGFEFKYKNHDVKHGKFNQYS